MPVMDAITHFKTRSEVRPAIRFRWMLVLTALFALLSVASLWIDLRSTKLMNPEILRGDFRRVLELSEFFAHGFCVAVVVWCTWVFAPHLRRHLLRLLMCVAWPPLVVHGIKAIVIRNRPMVYFDPQLLQLKLPPTNAQTWKGLIENWHWNVAYHTQSFPSAHAATVCGLAIGMCWLFPKGKHLFIFLACLSSFQRVAFFAHWPSDVFASVAVAMLVSGGLIQNWGLGYLMGRYEKEAVPPSKL